MDLPISVATDVKSLPDAFGKRLVALPALPMALAAKVLGLGHSAIQRGGFSQNAGVNTTQLRGVLPWIRQLDHRFNLDTFYDPAPAWGSADTGNLIGGAYSAVGGDHLIAEGSAPGTLVRTPQIISRNQPAIVYLDIGSNDVASGVNDDGSTPITFDTLKARLFRQVTALTAKGIYVVWQTICDRGIDWPQGSAQQLLVSQINDWIKSQAGSRGVSVIDLTGQGFNFPTFDTTLFGADQIHFAPKGAKKIADILLPVLQAMVTAGETWQTASPDVNNLFPLSGLLGSAGIKGGAYVTGNIASNYRVTRASGDSACVASKEVIDGTHEKQVLTFTPSGTAGTRSEEWRLNYYGTNGTAPTLSALGLAAGDWIEGYVFVELSAWAGWIEATMAFETTAGATGSQFGGFGNADGATLDTPFLSAGYAGWLRCGPWQVPAGSTSLRIDSRPMRIVFNRLASGTGVAKFSRPIMRKVSDPRVAWGY